MCRRLLRLCSSEQRDTIRENLINSSLYVYWNFKNQVYFTQFPILQIDIHVFWDSYHYFNIVLCFVRKKRITVLVFPRNDNDAWDRYKIVSDKRCYCSFIRRAVFLLNSLPIMWQWIVDLKCNGGDPFFSGYCENPPIKYW